MSTKKDVPLSYENFRSGTTFPEISRTLWQEKEREYVKTGQYIPVRRRAILWKLRQIKVKSYEAYLRDFEERVKLEKELGLRTAPSSPDLLF